MSPRNARHFAEKVAILVGFVGLAMLAWAWRDILMLVFLSILLATALHGLSTPLLRIRALGRRGALVIVGLSILATLTALVWFLGGVIVVQFGSLGDNLLDGWRELKARLEETPMGATFIGELDAFLAGDRELPVSSAASRIGSWTLSLAGGVLNAVVVVTAAIFLSASPATYARGVLVLAPADARPKLAGCLQDAAVALQRWLIGSLVSMIIMAVAVSAALWALGVPAFLALGIVAGLSQFVPLVGPVIAAIPVMLLALTQGIDTALYALIAYVVASQIEANLIYPLVQKRAVDVPPALTLFAIIAFGSLLGPLGALLAVPLTVVLIVFVSRLLVHDGVEHPVPART